MTDTISIEHVPFSPIAPHSPHIQAWEYIIARYSKLTTSPSGHFKVESPAPRIWCEGHQQKNTGPRIDILSSFLTRIPNDDIRDLRRVAARTYNHLMFRLHQATKPTVGLSPEAIYNVEVPPQFESFDDYWDLVCTLHEIALTDWTFTPALEDQELCQAAQWDTYSISGLTEIMALGQAITFLNQLSPQDHSELNRWAPAIDTTRLEELEQTLHHAQKDVRTTSDLIRRAMQDYLATKLASPQEASHA